jgi:hypothetical protein
MRRKAFGDGEPVVLLHGATGRPESYWASQIPVFSRYFQILLMQYPGKFNKAVLAFLLDRAPAAGAALRPVSAATAAA